MVNIIKFHTPIELEMNAMTSSNYVENIFQVLQDDNEVHYERKHVLLS